MSVIAISEPRVLLSFGRARSLSRAIAALLALGLWATILADLVLAIAVLFFFPVLAANAAAEWAQLSNTPLSSLGLGQRLFFVADLILYSAPTILILFNLRSLFVQFAHGQIFTEGSIARLKNIGLWLLISVVTSNLAQIVFFRIADLRQPDFDLKILPLMFGAMTYVAAYIMAEAQRIAADNAEIV